jgi:hypothetical protein
LSYLLLKDSRQKYFRMGILKFEKFKEVLPTDNQKEEHAMEM